MHPTRAAATDEYGREAAVPWLLHLRMHAGEMHRQALARHIVWRHATACVAIPARNKQNHSQSALQTRLTAKWQTYPCMKATNGSTDAIKT